ncbi:hypothetical protein FPV67DRAFT_1785806 [Lyophyllum atratum]|nr:hypothetical protein FPV67DRAFT_1785806 [Lyophyllum atratum]
MALTPTAIVTKAVLELGGPSIEPGDIEWTSQVPAGRNIVQWLVEQCIALESDDEDGLATTQLPDIDLGAALRAIALEDEEIHLLKHAESILADDNDQDLNTIHAPLAYAPPSRLRKHATHLDAETRLLEAESATLKSRLRQTKQASQRVSQTISSLEAAIKREDAAIAHMQERLAELSILADTMLSSGTDTALSLLDTLAAPPQTEQSKPPDDTPDGTSHASLISPTQSLTHLANFRSALTEQHTSRLAQLTPKVPEGLLDDAADLSSSFEALMKDGGRLKEAAYAIELRQMHEALGRAGSITDLSLEDGGDADQEDLDVKAGLEKAWALDQAAILDMECVVLDSTVKAHDEALLPALTALHTKLSGHEKAVRAAEAWVGTFVIEVEGVGGAGGDADAVHMEKAALGADDDVEFERELKDLLLQHHRRHHTDEDAPLVLLDRSDILDELRRIRMLEDDGAKSDVLSEVTQLREKLGSLSATHQPLLSLLYGTRDVQTNVSPPFGRSEAIKQLEQRAQEAVARLEAGVGRGEELQKTLDGKRTQRKFGEFIHQHS